MRNAEYYDYYIVNREDTAKAVEIHEENFKDMREAIQKELLENTGAIAWMTASNWGKPSRITRLVYPREHEIKERSYIMVESRSYYEGKSVIGVRGKLNSKAGREFNEAMEHANTELSKCLAFGEWIVHEYFKVEHTGLGGIGPSGHGVAMISTFGGLCESGNIAIAVPKDDDSSKKPEIPASFEPITYGIFYDLTKRVEE